MTQIHHPWTGWQLLSWVPSTVGKCVLHPCYDSLLVLWDQVRCESVPISRKKLTLLEDCSFSALHLFLFLI